MSREPRLLADKVNPAVWWGLAANAAGFCLAIWLVLEFRGSRPVYPVGNPLRLIQSSYLLEGLVLNGLVLLALYGEVRRRRPRFDLLWGALGALSGLAILSMWSAGMAFAPGLVSGLIAALFATQRSDASVPRAVGLFLAGVVVQVTVMVTVILALPQPIPPHR